MKIEINEQGEFLLKEVYTGIGLEASSGETFSICMRDSGFEFNYRGIWWEAKQGQVNRLTPTYYKHQCQGEVGDCNARPPFYDTTPGAHAMEEIV